MTGAEKLRRVADDAISSHKAELKYALRRLFDRATYGKYDAQLMLRIEHAEAVLEELTNEGFVVVKVYEKVSERQEFVHTIISWKLDSAE